MYKLYKKGLDFISAGQGFMLLILLPFFLKGDTNHRILQSKLELSLKQKIKRMLKHSSEMNIDSVVNQKIQNLDDKCIWFMWLQGIEEAPELVQNNYFYLKRKFGERVKIITTANIDSYLNMPKVIFEKWQNNFISDTHFSDIVRIQLLVTYGGIWIDSTAFAQENIMTLVEDKDFVIPRTFPPGANGKTITVSSWFIKAKRDNAFLKEVQKKLIYYWTRKNVLVTYFLLHYILIITSEEMNNYLDQSYPIDNTLPHYLMLQMRKKEMSKDDIKYLMNQFTIMKFTNKHISDIEINNYKILNSLLQERAGHGKSTD